MVKTFTFQANDMGSNPIICNNKINKKYSLTVEHCFLMARDMGSIPFTPRLPYFV